MTFLVVLVLVLLWAAVLTPMVVKRFRQGPQRDSVDTFHEQLHLLGRAGPNLVPPAHRLERVGSASPTEWFEPSRPDLVLVGTDGAPGSLRPGAPVGGDGPRRHESDGHRRRTRRRRRDLMVGLLVVAVATGGVGALVHPLWVVTVLSVVAIAGYVALAAYAQLLEAERRVYQPLLVSSQYPETATGELIPEASQLGSAVVALGARIPAAARAGYPGAWDDEPDAAYVPRRAATGS